MYECSGSQFFRTITEIQSGPDAFDESRFVMTFLTILRVMEILCSFGLVLEGKTGKGIPESSRLDLIETFLASNFALLDAEDCLMGLNDSTENYCNYSIINSTLPLDYNVISCFWGRYPKNFSNFQIYFEVNSL